MRKYISKNKLKTNGFIFLLFITFLNITLSQVPNDDCHNALYLGLLDSMPPIDCYNAIPDYRIIHISSNTDALTDYPLFNILGCSPLKKDIWFKFETYSAFYMWIFNYSDGDILFLNIWRGDSCNSLTPWNCFSIYNTFSKIYIDTGVQISSPTCPPYSSTKYFYFQFGSANLTDSINISFCIKPEEIYAMHNCYIIMDTICMDYNRFCIAASSLISNDGIAVVTVEAGNSPYTYSWSTGSTDSIITGLSPGKYFVTITDKNGCAEKDSIEIKAATTIHEQLVELKFSFYPNPALQQTTLIARAIGINIPYTFSIYNSIGELVYQQREIKQEKTEISGSLFTSGTYIYVVNSNTGTEKKGKFVVR